MGLERGRGQGNSEGGKGRCRRAEGRGDGRQVEAGRGEGRGVEERSDGLSASNV